MGKIGLSCVWTDYVYYTDLIELFFLAINLNWNFPAMWYSLRTWMP
jgi:hypothetical protein